MDKRILSEQLAALRAKVAEAAKICVAVQEVVTDPGMIGLAADILAALREGGSDE